MTKKYLILVALITSLGLLTACDKVDEESAPGPDAAMPAPQTAPAPSPAPPPVPGDED